VVRLTGSGLSIPEWPIINGSLLPPFSVSAWQTVYQTYHIRELHLQDVAVPTIDQLHQFQQMFWIEYGHRALAACAGIIFLTLLVQTFRNRELRGSIGFRMTIAAIALIIQAILGGLVVKTDIRPELLALHLGTAFFFIATIVWMALTLMNPYSIVTSRNTLNTVAWFSVGFVQLQVMSGALVAATFAGQLYNTWPLMNGYLLPPYDAMVSIEFGSVFLNLLHNPLTIQFIHRWLAFLTATMLISTVIVAYRKRNLSPRGRMAIRALPALITLQILLGLANLLFKVPFWFGLAHLVTAVPVYCAVLVIAYDSGHRSTESLSGEIV